MRILGVDSVLHDPAAAPVIDGRTVAAAEQERVSRRKHGQQPVAFPVCEEAPGALLGRARVLHTGAPDRSAR